MAKVKRTIGRVPTARFEYTDGETYYSGNIVTRYGSSFQCVVESTTTPPATLDASGKVTLGEGWIFFADTSAISNAVAEHTEKITKIGDTIYNGVEEENEVPISIRLIDGSNGYWGLNGIWVSDNTRRSSEKIDVVEGEKYLVTTHIGGSSVIQYLAQWEGDNFIGCAPNFVAGSGNADDREFIVPKNVTKIALTSYDTTLPSLKKVVIFKTRNFYTKDESDLRFAPKSLKGVEKYGIKWSAKDNNDLGLRCFLAEGKNASIAIGNIGGKSDFDDIFPWSEIKRCNIRINENGAKIVTFEGETGFALDGSNGDVFVRIPKCSAEDYLLNDENYIVISNDALHIHPAFIEDGKELDEIFIAAFEASESDGKLYSKSGAMPKNNIRAKTFLDYARAKGESYSLFDGRCVDLLFKLIAVEFGCRNTNRIFGYGYSGYIQPFKSELLSCSKSSQSTNTITIGKPQNNSERLATLNAFAVGQNICICGNAQDGTLNNIIAQRKITSIACASVDDNFVITFDGEPISVDAKVEGSDNYTYVGNAPIDCNYCEEIQDEGGAMSYHTGRTNRIFVPNVSNEQYESTMNACRYRWIENPIGNVWHFLPDRTFFNNQMYVCDNMRDYECHKYTKPYHPISGLLIEQASNGVKTDTPDANYWITSLIHDTFAKGITFGKDFDKSLVSTQAFGAYYYQKSSNIPTIISHGGGFDHLWRCNILTQRAWQEVDQHWYLDGARLMFKNI